jgi:DNA polymerase-3 subunit gamma/tau
MDVLGIQVKYKAQIDAKAEPAPAIEKVATTPIAVVAEPVSENSEEAVAEEAAPVTETVAEEQKSRNSKMIDEDARYGESLLREMLGAEPMTDKNGK